MWVRGTKVSTSNFNSTVLTLLPIPEGGFCPFSNIHAYNSDIDPENHRSQLLHLILLFKLFTAYRPRKLCPSLRPDHRGGAISANETSIVLMRAKDPKGI